MTITNVSINKDSKTAEYSPTTNYGTGAWLDVQGDNDDRRRRSYVEADITSISENITLAYLYLNLSSHYYADASMVFNRITDSWDELTITWNNPPGVSSTHQTTRSVPSGTGWKAFDITELVQDAKEAGNICGIRIINSTETTDSNYSYFSSDYTYPPYFRITHAPITDYYVKTTGDDSKNGASWANAWKTINKAATTVADGTTVHIGFGDYVNEPATNKIAPQNIGTSGIYYAPETAETGGGTGTVSIEQNP